MDDMLEHRISVYRKTEAANGVNTLDSEPTYSGMPCLILPLDSQSAQSIGLDVTKAYECFVEEYRDLVVGDRVKDGSRRVFYVRAVNMFNNFGEVSHKRLIIEYDKTEVADNFVFVDGNNFVFVSGDNFALVA